MQASEFVKEHGWPLVQRDVAALEQGFITKADFLENYGFEILDELAQLVKSWELIESLGGLVKAKTNLSSVEYNLSKSVWFGEDKLEKENFASRLRQAIADVESCQ